MVREVRRTINELIRAYDDMPTRHSRDALLSAIFDLNAWYVIELGEGENRPPCIAWEEEEPTLLVFTDEKRAIRALNTWLEDQIETVSNVRRVGLEDIAEFFSELGQWGIEGVRLNHGPWSVNFALDDAVEASSSFGRIDDASVEQMVDRVLLGSAKEEDILDRVCHLPSWYFVSDVADSDDPLIWIMHDEPCVLVFTDASQARSYAVEQGLEGCTTDVGRLIEVDPDAAVEYLEDLARRGVSCAMFNHGPFGFYASLGKLCSRHAA